MIDQENLMSPQELAEMLGVSPNWVYRAAHRGEIPHLQLGRHIRFVRASISEWIERQEHAHA